MKKMKNRNKLKNKLNKFVIHTLDDLDTHCGAESCKMTYFSDVS